MIRRLLAGIGIGRYVTILFLLFLVRILQAQPSTLPQKDIIFDQLPFELGLSQNSINCILQDHEGFLWVGTWSGLIRYDGYSSVRYHSDNKTEGLKSDKIITIIEDHLGYLWIGTQIGGLFRFDKKTDKFKQYNSDKSGLSNDYVWCIREDQAGDLWVGTENGLNVLDRKTDKFKVFFNESDNPNSISNSHIKDILLTSDNKLWVGTADGLNFLSPDQKGNYSFKKYRFNEKSPDATEHNYIFKLLEFKDKGGISIWASTARGLKKIQDDKVEIFQIEGKPQSYNSIFSILAVEGPHPFIITGSERGINFFDLTTNKFIRFLSAYDERLNLSHTSVMSLCLDQGGVLWVGTKKGLNKVDSYSKNFEAYGTTSFDKSRSIITGIQGLDSEGYLISTLGGGLYSFKDKKFQSIRIDARQENDLMNFVQTIFESRDGSIWIGTAGDGVYHVNQKDINTSLGVLKRFDHFNEQSTPALGSNFVMSLTEDNLGNVWVGSWHGGLSKITPDGRIEVFKDSLLINIPLVTLYADRTGVLWVGTRGNGLYEVKQNANGLKIRKFNSADKVVGRLTNNFVNSILEDHTGLLWIGTQAGLYSFDPRMEFFKPLKLMPESATNAIASVLEDNNGKLWISHGEGVTVIDPNDTLYVKQYDYHDRIQGGFFYNNVSCKDENGRLLFGGSEGFNIIEPSGVVQNPNTPKVIINDFKIFGKSIHYGNELSGRVVLNEPLTEVKSISLKSKENSISFEFTALDYAAPEKINYAYMLQGFDTDWNYTPSSRRYAVYTNLGEGTYVFRVRAANSDGVWSDHISELSVVIDPPWWKTQWAFIAYTVIVLMALYLFRRLILIRVNFKHDIKVERLQRESMEKLNQAKLQFFTNISHEFRTPLTLILGPIQNLIDGKEREKAERDQLIGVNNNANRLLRLVNQLLDFRKAESGNLKLNVSEGNIVKFVKEVKLSFDSLAENLKIDFSLSSSSSVITAWYDTDQFEKIMFNLVSNAFKHTPEGGAIALRVEEKNDQISIIVEDNGKGIKQEHFEKIFQTFFSYYDEKDYAGTGIGLAFAKSLVDMHQGQLEFASEENVFTRFVIRLRKGSLHFNPSDLCPISNDVESMDYYPSLVSVENLQVPDDSEISADNDHSHLQKLLIVEDNQEIRSYIKSIFRGVYQITEANNGQEGLNIALDIMPDLIISDVMMPVVDGIKLCSKLKSDVKTSHIPVILLTARTSLIFKVEGLETGADDYITKPFNPAILKLKVRNLIHTREAIQKMFQGPQVLNIEPKKVTLTSADELFVKQALDGIERNMSNPDYGIDDLGRDVGMSRTQLYKKLKGLTGQSGNEFIRTIRLKRAAQLLEQNQLTIAEVTHSVGFTDLQYFRDCFKKLFGVIPSEYVQNVRMKAK